jgi:Ca-activated chloride channel homolog
MAGLKRVTGALALAVILSTALAAQQPPAQGPTFKSGTQVVSLFVTVADATRRLVPGLTQDEFEVFDNEKPQPIIFFQNEIQPITVIVMLDTSGSMTLTLDLLREAAEQFLIRLLPTDKARVGAFNDKIQFSSQFTNNRDQLVTEVKALDYGNGTRLWDAVAASIDELKPVEGRRVVLVFTDGDDTSSKIGVGKVMDRAREKDIMIYGVGLVNEYFDGQSRRRSQPDRGLKRLAEDTGGGYFELKRTADLNETFTRVAQELHSQYVLGFSPETLDGKVHKLDVRVKKAGMTARARKTYTASATP